MTPMETAVANLAAAVTEAKGTEDSATTLIQEFAKYVVANKNDPAAIQAFADQILADKQPLADAVAANPDPDPND